VHGTLGHLRRLVNYVPAFVPSVRHSSVPYSVVEQVKNTIFPTRMYLEGVDDAEKLLIFFTRVI
jgi:hypothetical protein